jgi:hypothetical protein
MLLLCIINIKVVFRLPHPDLPKISTGSLQRKSKLTIVAKMESISYKRE